MFIGHFTERPYQDPESGYFGATGLPIKDLTVSNDIYDTEIGADLYNRYLDERLYAEEVGFDGIMLNEHHSTPFCMGGVVNVEASILAKTTSRAKIVILGNVLPIWDDPLWLVEQLATIDMISRGRLVSGWVRGTGRESVAHNSPPPYNWERFQEAHDFIVKAWTTPGPFRWEGKHYNYRYVNPWMRPYQKPHPPIWLPGVISRDSLVWAATNRIPYIMLATKLEPTKESFQVYHDTAAELGYESGPQNLGYLWKVHVDETEELADEVGRKFVQGPSNPFLAGNEGADNAALRTLPGMTSRKRVLPTQRLGDGQPRRRAQHVLRGAGGELHHRVRHAGYRDPEDTPRAGDTETRQRVLLGRRRRDDARRPDAQPAVDGRVRPARRPRDRRRTRTAQLVRGQPGHGPAVRLRSGQRPRRKASLTEEVLARAKRNGLSDRRLARSRCLWSGWTYADVVHRSQTSSYTRS